MTQVDLSRVSSEPQPLEREARTSGFQSAGSSAAPPESSETLKLFTVFAYTVQSVSTLAMGLLIFVFLSKFYVDVVLMPAGILAIAIAGGRAADALLDPCVGYLSDHTHSRWGRRKPWIAAGAIGGAFAFYALVVPPRGLSSSAVVLWFAVTFLFTYVFTAMAGVPRIALGVELTLSTAQRNKLYGMSAMFIALGTILGSIMPTLLQGSGIHDPREQMKAAAILYAGLNLVLNVLLLVFVPERTEFKGRGEVPFVPGVRRALRNRAFRVMFTSHIITAIPFAIPSVLIPFFVQYVLKLDGLKWTGIYMLAHLTAGFLALPIFVVLARKFGKLPVWFLASFIAATGGLAMFFVGPGDTKLVFWIEVYWGMQSAVWWFLGGAMHADVVDYDELHTGKRREAQFSSLWSLIPKFALIPGAALPLAIIGAVGYVPNRPEQSPEVLFTLRVLFSLVPCVLNIIGLALMRWYPLSEKVHGEIREGIAQHARGENAIDPITRTVLPPPAQRAVDEATAWFLDNFSRRELTALVERGQRVSTSVRLGAFGFGTLMVAAIACALSLVKQWDKDPGPIPALALVLAGLCFSGLVFHLLRWKPAAELDRAAPPRDVIQKHLASID